MDVELTVDQKAFVGQAIESGRIRAEEDAVREALLLWEQRERTRAELLAAFDDAELSFSRCEAREITPGAISELAAEIKRRGRGK